jgi:hypothetical protein
MILKTSPTRNSPTRGCGRSRYAELMILCARIGYNP